MLFIYLEPPITELVNNILKYDTKTSFVIGFGARKIFKDLIDVKCLLLKSLVHRALSKLVEIIILLLYCIYTSDLELVCKQRI